jgi:hypothetical protein
VKRPHNAHISTLHKVHYRYHPLYGTEVEITHRGFGPESVEPIVQLPDHTRCSMPTWMFDESHCASLVDREQPLISLEALCALAELLDCQPDLGCKSGHENKSSLRFKYASTDAGSPTAPAPELTGANASDRAPAVPGVADADAHHGSHLRKRKDQA